MGLYLGSCIDVLEDDYFLDNFASDATELAHIVDSGVEVTFEEFLAKTRITEPAILKFLRSKKNSLSFFINKGAKLAWYYDSDKDTEHFFELIANKLPFSRKASAILRRLVQMSSPDRVSGAGRCSSTLVDFDVQRGTAQFYTRCAGGKGTWEQIVELRAPRGRWSDLLEMVYGARVPDNVSLESFLEDFTNSGLDLSSLFARVSCDCPDFNYQGYAYLLHESGWGLPPSPEANRAPSIRNPQNNIGLCKHLISVVRNYFP